MGSASFGNEFVNCQKDSAVMARSLVRSELELYLHYLALADGLEFSSRKWCLFIKPVTEGRVSNAGDICRPVAGPGLW